MVERDLVGYVKDFLQDDATPSFIDSGGFASVVLVKNKHTRKTYIWLYWWIKGKTLIEHHNCTYKLKKKSLFASYTKFLPHHPRATELCYIPNQTVHPLYDI